MVFFMQHYELSTFNIYALNCSRNFNASGNYCHRTFSAAANIPDENLSLFQDRERPPDASADRDAVRVDS